MPTTRRLDTGDVDELTALYRTDEWWGDRGRADVEAAIAHTDLPLGLFDGGDLVGAARVLTDATYYARVYDVLVAPDRRGEGLGRRLLEDLLAHPDLAGVDAVSCSARADLVGFYETCGFERVESFERDGEAAPTVLLAVTDR